MIRKKVLCADRIRRVEGSFAFIPHRFLADGFLTALSQHELLLYLFLILAADRCGLSFYGSNSICARLGFTAEQYKKAREGLIEKDLIAFDGTLFQVLSLPETLNACRPHRSSRTKGPVPIAKVFQQSLKGLTHDR